MADWAREGVGRCLAKTSLYAIAVMLIYICLALRAFLLGRDMD